MISRLHVGCGVGLWDSLLEVTMTKMRMVEGIKTPPPWSILLKRLRRASVVGFGQGDFYNEEGLVTNIDN